MDNGFVSVMPANMSERIFRNELSTQSALLQREVLLFLGWGKLPIFVCAARLVEVTLRLTWQEAGLVDCNLHPEISSLHLICKQVINLFACVNSKSSALWLLSISGPKAMG